MLDAQKRAAMERDRQAALARIRKLRTSLLANHAASASENQESGCVAHHRDVPFARRNVF